MQKKTVVMIGSSCIDEYYEMDYVPRLGEKTLTRFVDRKVGGMIGNAAAVTASYGLNVYLMDAVNSGDNTRFILEDCEKAGIRLDMIRYDDSLPDTKCILFLKDGERIIYVVPTQKSNVEPDEKQKEILASAEYVYTNLEELKYFRDTKGFLEWLRSMDTRLVLDVERIEEKDREIEWEIIKRASLIFVNEEGDEQLREKISKDYQDILRNLGCMIVATKGSRGCAILTPEGAEYEIPAYAVKPVDTTGAGDTFNSSFLYGLTQGWEIQETGRFANGAAANAILRMGARSGAVGEEAVRKFMKENE
ncbi:MAG: carbohydrate kinase family protein [Lachnospiraceae bacterium]|nr:carbohydrate kinase family protein [Lachnospiraceae bacterium]